MKSKSSSTVFQATCAHCTVNIFFQIPKTEKQLRHLFKDGNEKECACSCTQRTVRVGMSQLPEVAHGVGEALLVGVTSVTCSQEKLLFVICWLSTAKQLRPAPPTMATVDAGAHRD